MKVGALKHRLLLQILKEEDEHKLLAQTWQAWIEAQKYVALAKYNSYSHRLVGSVFCSWKSSLVLQHSRQSEPKYDSEVTWQRREQKRNAAVRAIKASPEYKSTIRPRPKTPDAFNRTISKRQWEFSIQEWRRELRTLQ
eukprot:3298936-Karenia_brevis.AAC.2